MACKGQGFKSPQGHRHNTTDQCYSATPPVAASDQVVNSSTPRAAGRAGQLLTVRIDNPQVTNRSPSVQESSLAHQ
jgi:hypothetical protein